MPLSDYAFDQQLDRFLEATARVIQSRESPDYFTTVWIVDEDENVLLETLVPDGEASGADPYDVLIGFGKQLARVRRSVAALFVAADSLGPLST